MRPDEADILEEMAIRRGVPKPTFGGCFVMEEDGKIGGFVNGGMVGFVETIVAESPQIAARLFSAMEGSLMTAAPDTAHFATVTNPKVHDMLLSQGWEKVNAEIFIKRR